MEAHRAECLTDAKAILEEVLQDTWLSAAIDPDNHHYLLVTFPNGRLHFDYFNGWVRAYPSGRSAVHSICLHKGSSATHDPKHVAVRRIKELIEAVRLIEPTESNESQ